MENLTGGTPPVRYLLCVVPCKLYFAADTDTTAMFKTVTIPAGIDNANASSLNSVKVVAQAIQADGFASWNDAFAAFDAQK